MVRFVERHVAFDHSRVVLPWFVFARGNAPMKRLHRLALQLENSQRENGRPVAWLAVLFHPVVSLRQIGIAFRRYAAETRRRHGQGYVRQLADLLYLSWRLNQPPHDYYLQKMWLRPDRRTWIHYLQQREHVALVQDLRQRLPIPDFDDKLNLYHRLRSAGLPTIEVFLAARGGTWLPEFLNRVDDPALRQNLVIKPTDGTMFDGVQLWHYDAGTNTYGRGIFEKQDGRNRWIRNETVPLSEILERVLALSTARTFIVQPMELNHPQLDAISPHNIANFRLVTAWMSGRAEVVAAILRMGYDTQRWRASTYQADIDLESGRLGIATSRQFDFGYGERHIETGNQVTGTRLERWAELKSLAVRAHEQFPWMPMIGWDIVDTTRGPMVLEANACWGADISQIGVPFLGEVGYAEVFREVYDRLANAPHPDDGAKTAGS